MKKCVFFLCLTVALVCLSQGISHAYLTYYTGKSCVRYVKDKKPGGYLWDKRYPIKVNGQPTSTYAYWVPADDIWNKLWVVSRGSTPKVNSVMVINRWNTTSGSVGHVAIITSVTSYSTYKIVKVKHSNWEKPYYEAIGWYKIIGSKAYYSSNGTSYGYTAYPLDGFVYVP